MKKRKVLAVLLCAAMTAALAVGCGGSKGSDSSDKSSDSSSSSDDVITVGFSQVGAESDWRTANSQSMKDTFSKENGYDLDVYKRQILQTGRGKRFRVQRKRKRNMYSSLENSMRFPKRMM